MTPETRVTPRQLAAACAVPLGGIAFAGLWTKAPEEIACMAAVQMFLRPVSE